MKCKFTLISCLLLGLILSNLASAQNFVKNPDFEEELGPDNWTIVFESPATTGDFLVAGRTSMAHHDLIPGTWDGYPNTWDKQGGHFAPHHTAALMHAYFRQVLTNLTPLASYECSAWMVQYTGNDNYLSRSQVYLESIGGPTTNIIKRTPYVTANVFGSLNAWQRYVVTNTASVTGTMEIRLHYAMVQTIAQAWEYRNINAFYDHVSVKPVGQNLSGPPYAITSLDLDDTTLRLGWGSVSNDVFGVQTSTDFTNWSWAKLFLIAPGSTTTADLPITTNTPPTQFFRVNRLSPYP